MNSDALAQHGQQMSDESSSKASGSRPKAASAAVAPPPSVIDVRVNKLYYGNFLAVRNTEIEVAKHEITAFIGPSGCGKSTVLRCLNRMNDFVPGFRLEGSVHYQGQDIYAPHIDPVAVRRSIGMVFQQPNPFAMSIYKNVAFGLKLNGFKGNYDERIEQALRGAALWDEVKDKLQQSGLSLSGGQQQRLCIARAIAVEPDLLLMDEPCSALDPIATRRIEELMLELKQKYTIAIVTHNLQQAQRVADRTAFLFVDTTAGGRTGYLIEYRPTAELFNDPKQERTKEYIRGEFS
jgi:phosphate transport system ATP-binding protein